MSCLRPRHFEPIADDLEDQSLLLYPNHSIYTHMGCIALRTGIAIALMNPTLSSQTRNALLVIIIVAFVVFAIKYLRTANVAIWKSYPRMLIAYGTAAYLVHTHRESYAGMLILVDALMGVQSRHLASVLSCRK